MISTNPAMHDVDLHIDYFKFVWMDASRYSSMRALKEYEVLMNSICSSFVSFCQEDSLNIFLHQWNGFDPTLEHYASDEESSYYHKLRSALDIFMHKDIVRESSAFICTKMQRPMLYKIAEFAVSSRIAELAQEKYYKTGALESSEELNDFFVAAARTLIGMDAKEHKNFGVMISRQIIILLLSVNWADQFEKIQEQEVARNLVVV
jgi:hypothetical protein